MENGRADAIVIGSGFGGAVAALRLGEAGIRTVVFERGRRWPIVPTEDTFAPSTEPDRRSAWLRTTWQGRSIERYVGVRELFEADGMTVVQGAGVGGGSLVHAAVAYQPRREMFARSFGDAIDYDEMDRKYYPRARAVLGASPVPSDVLAAGCSEGGRRFLARAEAAGFRPRCLDLTVDWDIIRQELNGLKKPSFTVGEFTTNSGAKNSVDRNYLALAEATGNVEIRPLHHIVGIAERADGTFEVTLEQLDEAGAVVSTGVVRCRRLFLAAGSLGTTKLLLRARSKGALPRLSEHVGAGWGANGDRFIPVVEEQRMVTGAALEHFDNPHGPVVVEDTPNARLAITMGSAAGTVRYDPARDDVTLDWPANSRADVEATHATAYTNERFELRSGLPPAGSCVETRTVHPLGGAVLGRVCDTFGRVFGYDGLYVVDGALLPGTCGCANPSLTIAALAERAMERIIFDAGSP